ncbi:MAG: hypothetical protein JXA33_20245 [Anaerolineae bacterium]|nr:hypothetical protein [Anaerolineae bacterium]
MLIVTALRPALDGRQLGDRVDVVFYRGSERKITSLEFIAPPKPEAPPAVGTLADVLRTIYAQQQTILTELLNEVPESRLTWTPDVTKWGAKQVVAHCRMTLWRIRGHI